MSYFWCSPLHFFLLVICNLRNPRGSPLTAHALRRCALVNPACSSASSRDEVSHPGPSRRVRPPRPQCLIFNGESTRVTPAPLHTAPAQPRGLLLLRMRESRSVITTLTSKSEGDAKGWRHYCVCSLSTVCAVCVPVPIRQQERTVTYYFDNIVIKSWLQIFTVRHNLLRNTKRLYFGKHPSNQDLTSCVFFASLYKNL